MKTISTKKCECCDGKGKSGSGSCRVCEGTGKEKIDHLKRFLLMVAVSGAWGLIICLGVGANGGDALVAGALCFGMVAFPWSVCLVTLIPFSQESAKTREKIGFVASIAGFFLFIVIIIPFLSDGNKSRDNSDYVTSNNQMSDFYQSNQLPVQQTDSRPSTQRSGINNGHDWKRAGSEEKERFCQRTAAAMSKEFNREFSASFYRGALDEFYDSSDSSILNQNIHGVVGLITSSAIGK